MKTFQLTLPVLVVLTVSFFCPCFSQAQDVADAYYWNVTSGDYGTASNWRVNGIAPLTAPDNTSEVYIQTGTSTLAVGTASTTAPSGSAADTLTIGGGTDSATALISCNGNSYLSAISSQLNVLNNGTVTLTTNNAANFILDADLVINGGTVNGDTGRLRIRGTNNQMTSGSIKISTLSIGYTDGVGIASMEISGGTLSTEFLPVGHNQAGKLTISGGEINTGNKDTGAWEIGNGAKGEVFINGGTINVKNGDNWKGITIGKDSNTGQVTQTTGSVNANTITFGTSAENFYKISGGELNIVTSITVPETATFEMTGGTVTTKSLVLTGKTDFDLGGGNLTITGTTAPAFNIGNSNTTNTSTLSLVGGTYDKVISGNTNLTKTGDDTLTLSGTNTYTGATTISEGTLSVAKPANLGSGKIAIEENGTLKVTGTETWSKTFTGTGKIDVNPASFTKFLFNGSNITGFSGTVDIEKTRFRAATDTRTTNYITYNVGNPEAPTNDVQLWINTTTVNGTFNLASLGYTTNPSAGGGEGAIRLEHGSTVGGMINVLNDSCIGTFDGAYNASNTVSANINLNDKKLYIGNYNYTSSLDQFRSVTLSGAISGTGNLLLQPGTGRTVTISSANNSFTGTTTVGDTTYGPGTLVLTGENAIANSTSVIVNTGITFGGTTQTLQNLSGAGTISGSGALTLFNDTATTYSGVITGTGASVTKTGAGTLTLSGTNTYTGTTTISGGRIIATNVSALGTGTVANNSQLEFNLANDASGEYSKVISGEGALFKTGDGTLTLSGENTYTGTTTISGGRIIATNVSALGTGTVTNNAELEFNLANDASGTYGKALSGEGALFKTGAGTLTLSQKNTFTGDITVSAGTLALTYSVGTNYQRLTGAVTVTGEGSVLSLGGKRTLQQEIAPPSLVTVENGGNITLSAFQYFNNVSLNNGSITRSNGAGIRFGNIAESNIKVTGTEQSSIDEITLVKYQYSPKTTDLTVDVDSDASLLIKGIIDLDEEAGKYKGASVIKTGDGTLTLSGTVNYTGATTVSGGTLALTESANLNNSASITNNGIITATSAQTFNNLTGTGTITAADAVLTLVNPKETYTGTINGTGEVVINNSTDAAWKGTIDNTVSVTTTGSAALTLSTAQTYTGTTTVNADSTVNLTNEANLINSSAVVVNGTLNYSGYTGATTQTFNNLTGSGTITGADAVNLELCCNTADVEGIQFSGTINAGSATITKTGTGRLKLYNNDSSNQSLIASTLVVNSGRLDIQGWLNSALTVKNATVFSPGNSIGTTNITGDYTLENSGTLLLELGGIGSFDYDELIVDGDIDFQNGSVIQLAFDGVSPTENGSYGLVTSTGTITYGQTFDWDSILTNAGMSLDNWSLAGTDKAITLSYTKGVVAVPEPSTWALLILGALGMMYFRRKK